MSSFQKTTEAKSTLKGTKIKNNLPLVSSGIPSLDHIIGGGLPSSSIFIVEEDVLGMYSRVLSKYFLAEGIVCNHALFVASCDENPSHITTELPLPCTAPQSEETEPIRDGIDTMKIAWRYEGLSQVESSFGSNSSLGHHFDLSKQMDSTTVESVDITYSQFENELNNVSGFKNPQYFKLLTNIKNKLSNEEFQSTTKGVKNILRICIMSLGSPIWTSMDCEEDSTAGDFGQDLVKFLYCLRVLLRDSYGVAFITIPSHLFDDENLVKSLLYSADNAVKIESFAGSSRETNPVYKEYHGLFHITKLSSINSLVPFVPPSLDLAFKLKRKKFVIEKLHLPPELEDSSEREQDDITAVPSCGGFKKKDIDF